MGFVYIVLLLVIGFCCLQGIRIRKDLKKGPYWKMIPKGTIIYGYSFPLALLLISEKLWGKFSFVIVSVLAVLIFICLVSGLHTELKTKPLRGTDTMLPDDVCRKVITFCIMTPLISASIVVLIAIAINSIAEMEDYVKKKNKK